MSDYRILNPFHSHQNSNIRDFVRDSGLPWRPPRLDLCRMAYSVQIGLGAVFAEPSGPLTIWRMLRFFLAFIAEPYNAFIS